MQGIINFLKPPGMTSHDVVALTRRKLKLKKVGHTGTLDPMAAGVLPICIGKATKIIEYIQDDKKYYRAEMAIGQETDTQDRWGTVLNEKFVNPTDDEIWNAVNSFVGEIDQIPPMYSALKVKGKKLYELARQGIVIDRPSRKRTIYSINRITNYDNKLMFDVECSKGTYIRTLCHDIGNKLDSYGHMTFLLRTGTGAFNLENAVSIEDFMNSSIEEIESKYLKPIDMPFENLESINIPKWIEDKIMTGQKIDLLKHFNVKCEIGDKFLLYSDNVFIGIAERREDSISILKRLK